MAALATSASNFPVLTFNIDDYPGGTAIWGALPAVFDTSRQGFDHGVHVHARMSHTAKKRIDATYTTVNVISSKKQFVICEEAAVNFSMASIFNHKIISMNCSQCKQPILSSGLLSIIPHHEHLCNHCGFINLSRIACVINPIMALKAMLDDSMVKRRSVLPARSINIDIDRYHGGVQIWGSNPSIIWTAARPEESAIHVHAYADDDRRVVDNTYGEVYLNGEYLDIEMVKVLQIQQMIPDLMAKVFLVCCPYCTASQFDRGIHAVLPQTSRKCQECSMNFIHESQISNPVIKILK